MAYMRAWVPALTTPWDKLVMMQDIIAFLTGSTDWADFNILRKGTGGFIVNDVPAGWTLEMLDTSDYARGTYGYPSKFPYDSYTNPDYGRVYSVLSAPYTDFPSLKKYLSFTQTSTSANLNHEYARYDLQLVETWDGLYGTNSVTNRYISLYLTLSNKRDYWMDISVSSSHIYIAPCDFANYYQSLPIMVAERTTIHAGDRIEDGYHHFVGFNPSGDADNRRLHNKIFVPFQDADWTGKPYPHVGRLDLYAFSRNIATKFTYNGEATVLMFKPTLSEGPLTIGRIHDSVPIYWIGNAYSRLNSTASLQEVVLGGTSYIVHNSYPTATGNIEPILIKLE